MRIRVKICGITEPDDAAAAAAAGADALGFVLCDGGPRRVTPGAAARLGRDCPPRVARVGVFAGAAPAAVKEAAATARLTAAQLHGEETPEQALALDLAWYRVFPVSPGDDPARVAAAIRAFGDRPFMIHARPAPGEARGGAGRAVDWGLAAAIGRRVAAQAPDGRARLILSGGLTADNVGAAVRALRGAGLWGVDVSSGVENPAGAPGLKDHDRIQRFVQAVREAE